MAKGKISLPIWTKLVLGFLLLISLSSSACVLFLNIQHAAAEDKNALPSFNGYRYLAVTDDRFGQKYAAGSLLLLQPKNAYQPGDEVVAANRSVEDQQLIFNKRYLLLQLQTVDKLRATGLFIGMPEREPLNFLSYEIVGSVTHIVPHVGAVYDLMLGAPGYLLFLLLPLMLSIIWIIVMVNLSARRQADPERYGISVEEAAAEEMAPPPESLFIDEPKAPLEEEEPEPPVPSPDESFDLFEEEPAELEYLRESVSYNEEEDAELTLDAEPALLAFVQDETVALEEPASPEAENVPIHAASPFMDPLAKRGLRRAAVTPDAPIAPEEVPLEPAPAAPIPQPMPEEAPPYTPPVELAPPLPLAPEDDEAVAIYSGRDEALALEPEYLHQELSGSLAELKAALRESRRSAHVVDIVVGEQAAALEEDKLRRLEQINSFDPDKAIEAIKRENALFERSLASGEPLSPGEPAAPPEEKTKPQPKAEKPLYPSPAAEEFYRIQPVRRPGGEPASVPQAAREVHKPLSPLISVLGEEETPRRSRYHNRNEEERR